MAGHLVKAGHDVLVWNRTASKAAALVQGGARQATSLSELASDSSIVFLCVSRSEDVQACIDELAPHAQPGTLFVDHSTIDPEAAKRIHAQLRAAGHAFVDAPITGGSMGAQNGTLTIFLGGETDDVDRALPYLRAYAKTAEHVGPDGAGQMAKMANQIAVGGALLALCESLSFAKKAGLDLEQAWRLIGGGAGGSWAFQNYGPKLLMSDWSPGFSIDNQLKDFGYCRDAARSIDSAVPLTELAERLLAELQAEGRGAQTTAALYDLYLALPGEK